MYGQKKIIKAWEILLFGSLLRAQHKEMTNGSIKKERKK